MNMGLLLPTALIALLALAVPVLLHLIRQTEQKRIEFAALRWLVARAQPRRRPRFNEWLLLILRLLLLFFLAVWLAQPVLMGRPDLRPWVVVAPAIDASQRAAQLPARTSKDAQWHWLAPGFPSFDTPAPQDSPSTSTSISSLLRELDATLPEDVALTVLVPEQFDATDAQRARISRTIRWLPVPGTTAFGPATAPKPMRIAAYADTEHRTSLPYLRAAAIAWATQARPPAIASTSTQAATPITSATLREIAGIDALQADDTHLLWLTSAPVPPQQQQWVRNGGLMLLAQDSTTASLDWTDANVAWRDADGAPLALRRHDGKGVWLRMLAPFTPESMPALLEPEFPLALKSMLQTTLPVATHVWADAYAPAADPQAVHAAQSPRSLDSLFALLIGVLFGIERWFAMSMRRFRSA